MIQANFYPTLWIFMKEGRKQTPGKACANGLKELLFSSPDLVRLLGGFTDPSPEFLIFTGCSNTVPIHFHR